MSHSLLTLWGVLDPGPRLGSAATGRKEKEKAGTEFSGFWHGRWGHTGWWNEPTEPGDFLNTEDGVIWPQKKDGVLGQAPRWMDPGSTVPRERGHTQKATDCMSPLIGSVQNGQIHRNRRQRRGCRGLREGRAGPGRDSVGRAEEVLSRCHRAARLCEHTTQHPTEHVTDARSESTSTCSENSFSGVFSH